MKQFMILIGLLIFSSLKVSLSGQGLFDFGSEATSQFNRGKLEQDAGKFKEAIKWYKKAIETEPKHY